MRVSSLVIGSLAGARHRSSPARGRIASLALVSPEESSVPDRYAPLRHELAVANRILAQEGVIDAFGHVSVRHPGDAGRYFLARARSPELVSPRDIFEFDLDSQPVEPVTVPLYAERVIHGEIFKARPDVMAICHHHAPAVMPFCVSGDPIVPVFHLGAAMGAVAPFWDSRDEFGDTNLLVATPAQGASLARALGKHSVVLMRRHGATVVGASLREAIFRVIYSCDNAHYLSEAKRLGDFSPLTHGEIEMAQALYQLPAVHGRAWEYWTMRLAKRGGGAADSQQPLRPATAEPAVRRKAAAAKPRVTKKGAAKGRRRR
jgi:ribulose-5-phosphate 4-epimerase/fuculose-1-phosphate aldolase